MTHSLAPSWLPLRSALNLRDVGGLPVQGGGSVRHGVLLRSGSLRLLTEEDATRLVSDHRLRTVVDLRTASELLVDGPSALARAGVATAHLPLLGDAEAAALIADDAAGVIPVMASAYGAFLDTAGDHVATAARLVAWIGSGSVLVHCAIGKDRTGVTIAVLLDAVGTEREAVLSDYAATNEVVDDVFAALVGDTDRDAMLSSVPLAARVAQPDALREVLERLDREHGGAAGWLRSRGLDDAELHLLRHRLVRPAGVV